MPNLTRGEVLGFIGALLGTIFSFVAAMLEGVDFASLIGVSFGSMLIIIFLFRVAGIIDDKHWDYNKWHNEQEKKDAED